MKSQIPDRIVAEISRKWTGQQTDLQKPLLSQQFEDVIATNRNDGYELESWQFQCPSVLGSFHETIIAVFVERADP